MQMVVISLVKSTVTPVNDKYQRTFEKLSTDSETFP